MVVQFSNYRLVTTVLLRKNSKWRLGAFSKAYLYNCTESVRVNFLILKANDNKFWIELGIKAGVFHHNVSDGAFGHLRWIQGGFARAPTSRDFSQISNSKQFQIINKDKLSHSHLFNIH